MKHLDLEKIPSYGNCGTLDKTRILKDLNVDIYVGDHPNDILAAKNADVTSVFLKSTSSIQSINESDFEISDLRQMINILKFFQNSIF